MTDTQHTPGPWMRRTPRGDNAVMAEDGCFIAVVYTGPEDARLIAAAPDLLAALRRMLTLELTGWNTPEDYEEIREEGEAAIAKATGQTA